MGKAHRSYTPEFKVRVVLDLLSGKRTLGEASREYNVKDSLIVRWRQEFLERAPQIFEQSREKSDQMERIAELERALGRMTMQLELAKKVFGDSVDDKS
jgi:transposase-like protein